MPVIISKRVLFTFAGGVVLVTFICGSQSFDYMYDVGRGVINDEQALYQMERSGFMTKSYALFLTEVNLGTQPHDVEIRTA